MEFTLAAVAVLLILGFYFLPAIICDIRNTGHGTAIFLVNLLLGWTVLGWIAALIWAVVEKPLESKPVEPDGTLTIWEKKQLEKRRNERG